MEYVNRELGRLAAEERYQRLREFAYRDTMEEFRDIEVGGIRLSDVVAADLWKYADFSGARKQRSTWHWSAEFPAYQRLPQRFDIAIWRGNTLGALCYGQPSKAKGRLRLNLIESTPIRPTPLGMRAFPVIGYAAATYAELIGASELWVLDPDPNLEGAYMADGFGGRTYYHGKRVGQRRVL